MAITTQKMKVEDFIAVIEANAEVYPEFSTLPKETKVMIANVNICTGTAVSYFKDGKFWAVGGIRYIGLGEAWGISSPEARRELTKSELRYIKKEIVERQRDELNLWRVFAVNKISENFLEHLGFAKQDNIFLWTRT